MTDLIKCLVWDLDDTLWEGTLIEGDQLALRPQIPQILEALTQRGILNSIASRNDEHMALAMLQQFHLLDYFTTPQINWNPKVENIPAIAHALHIDISALAFIDDSPFEREAVRFSLPSVMVIEAGRYDELLDMPAFQPSFLTSEAQQRGQLYQVEALRKAAEQTFVGTRLDFLKSCDNRLTLCYTREADLLRVAELAQRTNQLNSTGIRYSLQEVEALLNRSDYLIVTAQLCDRFGDYGTIGAMILHWNDEVFHVESLMVSCRADGRGIPSALLLFALQLAHSANAHVLETRYRRTEQNRSLAILYQMMGFHRFSTDIADGISRWTFALQEQNIPDIPAWLTLTVPFNALLADAQIN
jgi:FkbH-like protein